MTLIAWQNGPVFRGNAVGTEQACCCGGCECAIDCNYLRSLCLTVNGQIADGVRSVTASGHLLYCGTTYGAGWYGDNGADANEDYALAGITLECEDGIYTLYGYLGVGAFVFDYPSDFPCIDFSSEAMASISFPACRNNLLKTHTIHMRARLYWGDEVLECDFGTLEITFSEPPC